MSTASMGSGDFSELDDNASPARKAVRWVLILLALGYWSCGRLRRNLLPLGLIGLVLMGSLAFLPWSLDSAPI